MKTMCLYVAVATLLFVGHSEAGRLNVRGYASPYQTLKPVGPTAAPTTQATTAGPAVPATDALNTLGVSLMNDLRAAHSAPALTANTTLQGLAAKCVKAYAKDPAVLNGTALNTTISTGQVSTPCANTGGGYELLMRVGSNNLTEVLSAVQVWYAEPYNFTNPDIASLGACEQKTQMLWKASTSVGCACSTDIVNAADTKTYNICSCIFNPPGNQRTGFSNAGIQPYRDNLQDIPDPSARALINTFW